MQLYNYLTDKSGISGDGPRPWFAFSSRHVTALTSSVCGTHREAEQMSQLFSGKHLSQTWLVRAVTCNLYPLNRLQRLIQPRLQPGYM